MSEKHVFILDVESIQDYIFSTNRLKTIIGASWRIDELNSSPKGETQEILRQNKGDPKNKESFVYSRGGKTVLVAGGKSEPFDLEAVRKFEAQIRSEYRKSGISVTTHIQKWPEGTGFATVYDKAERAVAQKKYNKILSRAVCSSPYLKLCEFCGAQYAEKQVKDKGGRIVVLCDVCAQKMKCAERQPRLFSRHCFHGEIDRIAGQMAAIVVMDGNGMGMKIAALKGLCPELLGRFSDQVEEIFVEAFDRVLSDFPQENGVYEGIRPLILAGDDICFIVDSKFALPFVTKFCRRVEEESKKHSELFQTGGITLSCGILFAKNNFPFNFGRVLAESLLKSAKRFSRENSGCSAVDFHLLTSSSGDPVEKTREREYAYDDNVLTEKPYKMSDLEKLVADSAALSGLARSKVKAIRRVLRKGRETSMLELLKMASRLDDDRRNDFFEILNRRGWNRKAPGPWRTGLLDIAEISDIVAGGGQ